VVPMNRVSFQDVSDVDQVADFMKNPEFQTSTPCSSQDPQGVPACRLAPGSGPRRLSRSRLCRKTGRPGCRLCWSSLIPQPHLS
jgi:hypothetical protein